MPRSIQEALSDAYDAIGADVPEQQGINPEPVEIGRQAETPEPERTPERVRDDAGRFARDEAAKAEKAEKPDKTLRLREGPKRDPKTGGVLKELEAPAAGADAPQGEARPTVAAKPGDQAQQPAQPEAAAPPPHWNGKGKVDWNKLPAGVKAGLAEDYKQVAELRPVAQVLAPYAQRFATEFGGTDRALGSILQTWQYARQKPDHFAAQFIQGFSGGQPLDFLRKVSQHLGVDPRLLSGGDHGGNGGQQPGSGQLELEAHPVIAELRQQLQQATGQLQQLAQQPVIAQNAQIDSEIQAFQADPAHPYFNDVKPLMAALMGTPGGPATLKEAYEQACYANPRIRSEMMAADQANRDRERQQAVRKAQGAAVQVNGAPGVARPAASQTKSLTEALSRNYDEMMGGGRA